MWQEATRVHVDAREGRHVLEWGWRVKRPRVSGPWLEYWGGNATALNRPPIQLWFSLLFLLCGTMFLRIFFCRQCGGTAGIGSDRKTSIAWTRVHAIVNQSTCANPIISDAFDGRHVAWRQSINLQSDARDHIARSGERWAPSRLTSA